MYLADVRECLGQVVNPRQLWLCTQELAVQQSISCASAAAASAAARDNRTLNIGRGVNPDNPPDGAASGELFLGVDMFGQIG